MKYISLPLFLTLLTIPQLGTAAPAVNPAQAAFNDQQNAESMAFSQQLAAERAAWLKANPQIVKDLDARGEAILQNNQNPSLHLPVPSIPAAEQAAYDAFVSKQRAEGAAFGQKLNQERQNFINSGGTASTTTP